ncbi:hypothetical protein F5B18DRAFT_671820 [Nemania serpens]|nr:hypothetical protein F5B18DRAFT_671820 [Nemania serpens]
MSIFRQAIKAIITWLMIQMLYSANTGIFYLGMVLCGLFGSDTGPFQPSLDMLLFFGTGMTSKHLETLRNPHELTFDAYIILMAAFYLLIGDKFRVLLLGAWLPYYYFHTNAGKCWTYTAAAMAVAVFPYFRHAYQAFWPSVSALLCNSIRTASLESCTSAVKATEATIPSPPTPSLPLPTLSFSNVITMANIEPMITPALPLPTLSFSGVIAMANIEPMENDKSTMVDSHTQTSCATDISNTEISEKPKPKMVDSNTQTSYVAEKPKPIMVDSYTQASSGTDISEIELSEKSEPLVVDSSGKCDKDKPVKPYCTPKRASRSAKAEYDIAGMSPISKLASMKRQETCRIRKNRLSESPRSHTQRRNSNMASSPCTRPSPSAMVTPLSAPAPESPPPSSLDETDHIQEPRAPLTICVVDSTPESPPHTPGSPFTIASTAITSLDVALSQMWFRPQQRLSQCLSQHRLLLWNLFIHRFSSQIPPISPVMTATSVPKPEFGYQPHVDSEFVPFPMPDISLARPDLLALEYMKRYLAPPTNPNKMVVDSEGIDNVITGTGANYDGDIEMGGGVTSVEDPQNSGAYMQYLNSVGMEVEFDNGVGDDEAMSDPEMLIDEPFPQAPKFGPAEEYEVQPMVVDSAPRLVKMDVDTPKVGMIQTENEGRSQVMADPFHPTPPAPSAPSAPSASSASSAPGTWISNPGPSFGIMNEEYRTNPGECGDETDDEQNDEKNDETDKNSEGEQWEEPPRVREALTQVVVSTAKLWLSSATSTCPVEKVSSTEAGCTGESVTSKHLGPLPPTPVTGPRAGSASPDVPPTPTSASEAVPMSFVALFAAPPVVQPRTLRVTSMALGDTHRVLIPVPISKRLPPPQPRPSPIEPLIEFELGPDPDEPKLDRRFIVSNSPTAPQCKILPPKPACRPKRDLDAVPRAKEGSSAEEYEDNDGYRQKVSWEQRGSPPLDEDARHRLEKTMDDAAKMARETWAKHQEGIDEETAIVESKKSEEAKQKLEAKKAAQAKAFLKRMEAKKRAEANPLCIMHVLVFVSYTFIGTATAQQLERKKKN